MRYAGNVPKHIAIIMDGNGRWAEQHGLSRSHGHRKGIKNIKQIIKAASELGIKIVTFFAFSTENWQRPKKEIDMLMRALSNFLDNEITALHKNNIRFRVIGRDKPLSLDLLVKLRRAQELTAQNSGLTVVLALNYGGRAEIIDALRQLIQSAKRNNFEMSQLNEETFSRFLYASDLPDPDLFIRTSGELRLSNFLLWQLAYTELYFARKFWPDFTKDDLVDAIIEYKRRQRRFGHL